MLSYGSQESSGLVVAVLIFSHHSVVQRRNITESIKDSDGNWVVEE